ncbi:hypothetical protein D3C87_1935100 [compost metagenome]
MRDRSAIVRSGGQANAGGYRRIVGSEHTGRYRQPNGLGMAQRVGMRQSRTQDDELLAAVTKQPVALAQVRLHHLDQFLQNAVAFLVAEAVVDALEMVDVDDQQADWSL